MNKIYDQPIDEIIKQRISVRSFSTQPIPEDIIDKIHEYINLLDNPFGIKVTIRLVESDTAINTAKLGTYGVIKGAKYYIGATVKNEDLALESLGYEFEKLILYLTSLGIGTCWLGGTFKRSEFAKALAISNDEIFPVISPMGYAADKNSFANSIMRFVAKSDSRKPWDKLFFNQNFSEPLSISDTEGYETSLEMLRLAPSASNKQPWRIIKDRNLFNFYEYKAPGYSNSFRYDIQRIDMGIAACHFHLTAIENGLIGEFKKLENPVSYLSENKIYIITWISKQDF